MINNRQGGRRRGRGGGQRPPNNAPNPGNRQDNRNRGNAAQLLEKYKSLARDTQLAGDRVQTEYYLQFADHYFRVLNENRARFEEQRRQRDEDEDETDEFEADADGNEAEGRDDPRRDDARYESRRAERDAREDRPERGGNNKADRSERGDRNGEYRAERRPRRRAEADEDEGQGERISLDVLPPAIAPANEDAGEEKPARARRTRRPRATDEDIAPAA